MEDHGYLVTPPVEKQTGDLRGPAEFRKTAEVVETRNTSGILGSCQSVWETTCIILQEGGFCKYIDHIFRVVCGCN